MMTDVISLLLSCDGGLPSLLPSLKMSEHSGDVESLRTAHIHTEGKDKPKSLQGQPCMDHSSSPHQNQWGFTNNSRFLRFLREREQGHTLSFSRSFNISERERHSVPRYTHTCIHIYIYPITPPRQTGKNVSLRSRVCLRACCRREGVTTLSHRYW